MWKLKSYVAESIISAARQTYPDEFLALLGGKRDEKVIEEIVVVPAVYGKNFSYLRNDLIPFDSTILGSVHSHPGYSNMASANDLISFPKMGEIHIIISYPFTINSMRLFDLKGRDLVFEVID